MEDTKTTAVSPQENHETGNTGAREWATVNLKVTRKEETPAGEPQRPQGNQGIGVLEAVYGIIFQPVATLRQLSTWGRFRWGLFIYALILLFDQVVVSATLPSTYWETMMGVSAGTLFVALYPALMGITFTAVAVLHACALLLGGKGQFRGFFAATAFAALPMVFLSLLSFLEYMGSLSGFFSAVPSLVVALWLLVLQVLAVRESHLVSTGKAVLICFLPFMFMLVSLLWLVGWGAALVPHLITLPSM